MKTRSAPTEMNLDSLLDTVTNVVGILVLVLVLITLNIQRTVERIREEDPSQLGVTEEMLEEIVQRSEQQREIIKELQVEVFGLDVRLEQDRNEIREQQKILEELRDVPPIEPVDLKELERLVEERKKKQEELQKELTEIDEEIAAVEGELGETPEMEAPPPQIVRLPNPRPAPKEATEVRFMCREGRVIVFDPALFRDRVTKQIEYLMRPMLAKAGPGGEIDCQLLAEMYNKRAHSDQEFRSRLVVENFRLVLVYEHRGAGETPDRLRLPTSRFQRTIRAMDPEKSYARFLVWPDSFDVYVQARALCDARGLLAGWEPYTEDFDWKERLDIKVHCLGKPEPKPPPVRPPTDKPTPPRPPLPSDTID
jgi:hypothetical protein